MAPSGASKDLTTVLLIAVASGGGGIGLGSFVGSPPTTIELSADAAEAFKASAEAEALRANILNRIENAVVENGSAVNSFRAEIGLLRMEVINLKRADDNQSGLLNDIDKRLRVLERTAPEIFKGGTP
jgi:hypothetical protein